MSTAVPRLSPHTVRTLAYPIGFALLLLTAAASAQTSGLIEKMAANEVAARQDLQHFAYTSEERSTRTGNHLWKERVVETSTGSLRRLLAIDNQPLSAVDAQAEQRRIDDLVAHPDDFRRQNQAHKDDEVRATQLLQILPRAFLITPAGEQNGCTRFTFQPNPAFQPSSYAERVAHQMAGAVSLKQPDNRLCTLDARIIHPVEFGFGVLGHIDQGGYFSLERKQIDGKIWKSDRISVHITGRILLLKTLAQNQDVVRTLISVVPQDLTLEQAAQMTSRTGAP